LSDRVRAIEATGFDHPDLTGPFDLVFANILKGPLIALAPDLSARLRPGGFAILSGILNEQADDVVEVYSRLGNSLDHRQVIGEWTTLTFMNSPKFHTRFR